MPRETRQRLHLKPPPTPGSVRLHAIYSDLMTRPNVVGCFVGRKRRKGREQRSLAIVCIVSQKLPKKHLQPQVERLPETVDWQTGIKQRQTIATDVLELTSRFASASSVSGPGDDIMLPGVTPLPIHATVGFALQHPIFGHVVTTAGHLLLRAPGEIVYTPETRPAVVLANAVGDGQTFQAIAVKAVITDSADYALIVPESAAPPANLYRDTHPIGQPYLPSASDIGTTLLVLTGSGAKPAKFIGVAGVLPAGVAGTMRHLLVTTFATAAGDSGASLVDAQSRLWGTLVGAGEVDGKPCSLFISSLVPLAREQATFL